jgi:PEP-CTERM motif
MSRRANGSILPALQVFHSPENPLTIPAEVVGTVFDVRSTASANWPIFSVLSGEFEFRKSRAIRFDPDIALKNSLWSGGFCLPIPPALAEVRGMRLQTRVMMAASGKFPRYILFSFVCKFMKHVFNLSELAFPAYRAHSGAGMGTNETPCLAHRRPCDASAGKIRTLHTNQSHEAQKMKFAILLICSAVATPAFATTILSIPGATTFTAPIDGAYTIVAFGAQGGNAFANVGGLGAEIGGTFTLLSGEILTIDVGGAGAPGSLGGGGGGGGTFVVDPSNTILVIAGGGGGAADGSGGGEAVTSTAAISFGISAGFGGTGGAGGSAGTAGSSDGGGGGGFNSAGTSDSSNRGGGGGASFAGGLAGGVGDVGAGTGGFGGGAGAALVGGGGGGGDGFNLGFGGGGGGSNDALGTLQIALAGENSGDGSVDITFEGAPTPEPASLLILAVGLAALIALRRRSAATPVR